MSVFFTGLQNFILVNGNIPIILVGYSGGGDASLLAAQMAKNAGMDVRAVILLDPGFTTGTWYASQVAVETRSHQDMANIVSDLTTDNIPVYIVDNGTDYIDIYLQGTGAYYARDLVTADHRNVDNNIGVRDAIYNCIFQNSCSGFTTK